MSETGTKPTAVQFGAGNIGRGFTAQLFYESGLQVVFVDVVESVIGTLNSEGRYTIRIVGPGARDVPIAGIRAVSGLDRARVAEEIAACAVACTAVGAGALRHIAASIAAGLAMRLERNGTPLNILVCENLHEAGATLRSLVAERLPDDRRDAVLSRTGFAQAVVSRMVPLQPVEPEEPLMIRVEEYKRLPIDARALVAGMPAVVGVEPVANFEAHEARKLFTHNCAHATLGYLGWLAGLRYGHQALGDDGVRSTLDRVLDETGQALMRRHGFGPDEHHAHVSDLLRRFANVELGDTCYRLARDPLRKLAPHDRLVGAARLCEAERVEPSALASVIGAALHFDAAEDASAVELQRKIASDGLEATLQTVCGIEPGESLGGLVTSAYERARHR